MDNRYNSNPKRCRFKIKAHYKHKNYHNLIFNWHSNKMKTLTKMIQIVGFV